MNLSLFLRVRLSALHPPDSGRKTGETGRPPVTTGGQCSATQEAESAVVTVQKGDPPRMVRGPSVLAGAPIVSGLMIGRAGRRPTHRNRFSGVE